jgi:hypothetical protein
VFQYFGQSDAPLPIPPTSSISLQSNTFSRNVFVNPISALPFAMVADFSGIRGVPSNPLPLPLNVGNNLIADNNFPLNIPGPRLLPASGFVDGGGNVCNPNDGGTVLACGTTTTVAGLPPGALVLPSSKHLPSIRPPLVSPARHKAP